MQFLLGFVMQGVGRGRRLKVSWFSVDFRILGQHSYDLGV